MHASLTSYALSAAPPYQALSYTWGDRSRPCSITLNETEFPISLALHQGLLQLLQSDEDHNGKASTYLWIDSM